MSGPGTILDGRTGIDGNRNAYLHLALFHAGDDELAARLNDFILDGLSQDEPVAAAVRPRHQDLLRDTLGSDAQYVTFVDIDEAGRNPSRMISAWSDLTTEYRRPGRRVRGVGELVWPGRTPDELVECHHHESLINAAADDLAGLTLLCPYDTEALDASVIAEARRTHPLLVTDGTSGLSEAYQGVHGVGAALGDPLPEPDVPCEELAFDFANMHLVPEFVVLQGRAAGLSRRRVRDMMTAVSEAAFNSLLHAGGRGVLRGWLADGNVVHEVRDSGRLDDTGSAKLAGHRRPSGQGGEQMGLWLINQLCDLVQLRSSEDGTVVRMHVRG